MRGVNLLPPEIAKRKKLAQKRQEQRQLEGAEPGAKEDGPGTGVPQEAPIEEPATTPE